MTAVPSSRVSRDSTGTPSANRDTPVSTESAASGSSKNRMTGSPGRCMDWRVSGMALSGPGIQLTRLGGVLSSSRSISASSTESASVAACKWNAMVESVYSWPRRFGSTMPMASIVSTPSCTRAIPRSSTPIRSCERAALGCAFSVFMETSMNRVMCLGAFRSSV